ncbi:enoyl-CoA hydratase/isomerase family protein [Thermodesulfobacteriota bacterium]
MGLIYEKRKGIAYLTLNRPEAHNAMDSEMIVELASAWEDYRDDKELRCAIITGAGDKTFCSGADLAKLIPLYTGAKKPESEAEKKILEDPNFGMKAMLGYYELFKPVIAAVNGHALAGGFEILYGADIRVASRKAMFGLQEVKWAVFPSGGSTVRLAQQIPYAKAMEILLTGERIDAEEACRLGFVNKVVDPDRVMEEAERFARIIAKNGPLAVSAIKKSVLSCIGLPLREGIAIEAKIAAPIFATEDAREGPRAFKEKREPQYKGI